VVRAVEAKPVRRVVGGRVVSNRASSKHFEDLDREAAVGYKPKAIEEAVRPIRAQMVSIVQLSVSTLP